MNIRAVLRECAVDLLNTEEQVTVEQVVFCAKRRHGDSFAEAAEQMVSQAARTLVAEMMRGLAEDEHQQLSLLSGLPTAIAVQTEARTYYIRSDKAKWPELMAGRQVRLVNVRRAQAKLDAYNEACETLRPFMRDDTTTVAEATSAMREQVA